MALTISKRDVEGIEVCSLAGSITAGATSSTVRELIKELNASGHNRVVFDLKGVDFIDSTGLGALILAHSSLKAAGGALKLANLTKRSIQLLIITKLTTVFQLYNDESDAINSFFPNRQVKPFDVLQFVQAK